MRLNEDQMTALMKARLYNTRAKQSLATRDKWIARARLQGYSLRYIGERVDMSASGVAKVLQRQKAA